MFVISHYVLPLLERRDRGAAGEEQVGGLLDCLCENRWLVIHDASLGRGNIDHILIGPAGIFTVETKSHPGRCGSARVHGETISRRRPSDARSNGSPAIEVEPLIVLQPRLGGPAAGAAQGRSRAARADARRATCESVRPQALARADRRRPRAGRAGAARASDARPRRERARRRHAVRACARALAPAAVRGRGGR